MIYCVALAPYLLLTSKTSPGKCYLEMPKVFPVFVKITACLSS